MYFNPRLGVAVITLDDVEQGTPLKRIETACNVVVSPVKGAQVIVREGGHDIVFDAVHGQLPDGLHVVAVKDEAGAFPDTVNQLICRIILDPYQVGDEPRVIDAMLVAWAGGCPICGELTEDDLEEFDEEEDESGDWEPDDEDDSDEGEDWKPDGTDGESEEEEPPAIDMPRRFVYDDIVKPGAN